MAHTSTTPSAVRIGKPSCLDLTDYSDYSNKPPPMAPTPPPRSSSCKQLQSLSASEHGWPRRSTSLPRLPSTSEELETLPATTYAPPQRERRWSTISEDGSTLRLVEPRSVHLELPPSSYKGVAFRATTPTPSSPPLRRKHGSPNMKDVAVFDDTTRRECFVRLPSDIEIKIISPSLITSPFRSRRKKSRIPRTTSRGNKLKRKSLVRLSMIEEACRYSGTVVKTKTDSLYLVYTKAIPRTGKRRSKLLVPKIRCPLPLPHNQDWEDETDTVKTTTTTEHTPQPTKRKPATAEAKTDADTDALVTSEADTTLVTKRPQFSEYDVENQGEVEAWEDVEMDTPTADDSFIAESGSPTNAQAPFTVVYRQILEERWSARREVDAARAKNEKREVAEFLAKTDPTEPTAPPQAHLRPKSAVRSLPLLDTKKASKADRRLTASSPHLFPTWKQMEEAEKTVAKDLKKHWWSRIKPERGDSAEAARRLGNGELNLAGRKLSKPRLSMATWQEDDLRRISVYRGDAGLRGLGR